MKILILLILVVGLTSCSKPRALDEGTLPKILRAFPVSAERESEIEKVNRDSETFSYQQKVSHMEGGTETFSQRYFYNGTYAKGPDAPVIFLTCGEWTCDPKAMVRIMGKRAEALGAHLVSMEHRYYGESLPGGKEATELPLLKDLRMRDALEDFSVIQSKITADKNLKGKWIVAGCSYGGTIAAYYRALYPHLVAGAYASSGPVIATPDGFNEYDSLAAGAFGSECKKEAIVAAGYLHDLASTDVGLAEVKKLFGYSTEKVIQQDIDSVLVTAVPEAAQYGVEGKLCAALKAAVSPREKALALIQQMKGYLGERFYSESLVGVNELKLGTAEKFGDRWVYQTCAEATWHYSTSLDPANSLFPFKLDGSYYREACRRMYGTAIDTIKTNFVSQMQKRFEGNDTSHILFNNGSKDPWSTLSYTKTLSEKQDLTSLVYVGGSHCAEMVKEPASGDAALKEVQRQTLEKMKEWLR